MFFGIIWKILASILTCNYTLNESILYLSLWGERFKNIKRLFEKFAIFYCQNYIKLLKSLALTQAVSLFTDIDF